MKVLLIGGCDRSGTTLLGSMLGASPGALCTPESQFKTEILECNRATELLRTPRLALAAITRHWRFALWGLSKDRLQKMAAEPPSSYEVLLEGLVYAYADCIRLGGGQVDPPKVWVDHTPSNIRHLDRLFAFFPDALSIHIVRDGRAVAASVMPLDWGPNTAFFAARWWAQQLSPGLAAEQFFSPRKVMRVRFEDLVASPESELKRICRFADIEYVEKMCHATGFRVPRYTADHHRRLFSGRVDESRARRWRRVLNPKQIGMFEYASGDLLPFLGYALENRWPAAPSPPALINAAAREVLYWLKNRGRRFLRKRRLLQPQPVPKGEL